MLETPRASVGRGKGSQLPCTLAARRLRQCGEAACPLYDYKPVFDDTLGAVLAAPVLVLVGDLEPARAEAARSRFAELQTLVADRFGGGTAHATCYAGERGALAPGAYGGVSDPHLSRLMLCPPSSPASEG